MSMPAEVMTKMDVAFRNSFAGKGAFRSRDAIVAQPKNCHLQSIPRLSSKMPQHRHTCLLKRTPLDGIIVGCTYHSFELNCSVIRQYSPEDRTKKDR